MSGLPLSLAWPAPEDPRQEEKRRALADLGLQPCPPASGGPAVIVDLPADDPAGAATMVVDAFRVLAATDLDLCFWPPCAASRKEASHALRLVGPSSERRALLLARSRLRAAVDDDAEQTASKSSKAMAQLAPRVLQEVQKRLDSYCNAPASSPSLKDGTGGDPVGGASVFAHPAMRAREVPGRGLGLVAAAPVDAGVEVLRCPEGSLLNVFTALLSEHFGRLATLLMFQGIHAETVAMLFAVAERRRCCDRWSLGGAMPPWAELLARAPTVENAPQLIAWPCEAVAALGCAQVAQKIAEEIGGLWDLCTEVKDALKRLPQAVATALRGPIGFDDMLWARCLFDGRAVSVKMQAPAALRGRGDPSVSPAAPPAEPDCQWIFPQGAADIAPPSWARCPLAAASLAPVVDLLNHDPHGVCASPTFHEPSRSLVVSLVSAATPGRELCIFYGPLQNFELLMHYGFCPKDNPFDRLTLGVDAPREAAAEVLLRMHGIPTDHVLRPEVPSDGAADAVGDWACLGPLPPQLLRCIRLSLADSPATIDLDAAPGADPSMIPMDMQCLEAIEGLLANVGAQFAQQEATQPLWWPLYEEPVTAFWASQVGIVAAARAAANTLWHRLQKEQLRLGSEEMVV